MEEIPQGTFRDELEWCISQLETGLLRLNPTPKQAEETQRILGVLRSRKAPFVKKREVMHCVFGNYRLKMAEERKRTAKAATKPEKAQIQPGDHLASGSVVYRTQRSQPSEAPRTWFTPADNSFQFDFAVSERTPEEMGRTVGEAPGAGDSREQSAGSDLSLQEDWEGTLDFSSTRAQEPGFAFNFIIPDEPPLPPAQADPGAEAAAEAASEADSLSKKPRAVPESSTFPKPDGSGMVGGRRRDGECPVQEVPNLETAQTALLSEHKEAKPGAADGASGKKKKKWQPSKAEQSDAVNGDREPPCKGTSGQAGGCQSDEQLQREVDWCVEQLELGLKTQKSTPKQTEEALRAVRTLRSEKAVLAKKRQVMRAMCGDYRTKMAEERRKQLKLMQAASKAARIAEVTEDARRKCSRVFRKSVGVARRNRSPPESSLPPPASSACPGERGGSPLVFESSQEEFCFNFF